MAEAKMFYKYFIVDALQATILYGYKPRKKTRGSAKCFLCVYHVLFIAEKHYKCYDCFYC